MPFKEFAAGDLLTTSNINAFMMNQSIMVFDDATARDGDLPNPIEGMTVYRKDDNVIEFYDGSGWRFL